MRDVTDQLRSWSSQLADAIPRTKLDVVVSNATARSERRPAWHWPVLAAAAVITVGAVVVAVATLGDDSTDIVTVATEPAITDDEPTATPTTAPSTTVTVPATDSPTPTTAPPETTVPVPQDRLAGWPAPPTVVPTLDDVPYLVPTAAVTSSGPPLRSDFEAEGGPGPLFTQIFVDDARDAVMTLQTFPGQLDTTPPEVAQPLSIDGWDSATTGPFVSDPTSEAWIAASDPGGYVRLFAGGIGNDEASRILASMQRRGDGQPGWDLADEFAGLVEINGAWNSTAPRRDLTWFTGTSVTAQMISSPANTDLIAQALSGPIERVDVNGAPGWLQTTPGGRSSIVWSPDGVTVVVLGVADPTIDPLTVARSVTAVESTRYDEATTTEPPAGLGDGCSGSLFC